MDTGLGMRAPVGTVDSSGIKTVLFFTKTSLSHFGKKKNRISSSKKTQGKCWKQLFIFRRELRSAKSQCRRWSINRERNSTGNATKLKNRICTCYYSNFYSTKESVYTIKQTREMRRESETGVFTNTHRLRVRPP